MSTTNPPLTALVLQLLEWVEREPRTYAQAMEAWRSTCPRLSVWDDASIAGLIQVHPQHPGGMKDAVVSLTPLGRAALAERRSRDDRSDGIRHLNAACSRSPH